jgi:hypothetical protein
MFIIVPSNGDYGDFVSLCGSVGVQGDVFYSTNPIFVAFFIAKNLSVIVGVNRSSSTVPATFGTDFPSAVQLNANFGGANPHGFAQMNCSDYDDFKLLCSLFDANGQVYYSINTIGGVSTLGIQAVSKKMGTQVILQVPASSLPATLLTDFPNAVQLVNVNVLNVGL